MIDILVVIAIVVLLGACFYFAMYAAFAYLLLSAIARVLKTYRGSSRDSER
jgi:hypothetical protein